MSQWGVFKEKLQDYEKRLHVAPSDSHGVILSPHVASLACPCLPVKDAEWSTLYVHNDPERSHN